MRSILSHSKLRVLIICGLLVLAMYLAWFAYSPGLSGGFVFDDGPNIVENQSLIVEHLDFDHIRQAALSSGSGPFRRPISMLSFVANISLTGMSPYYFKLTNLAIHLVNGVSLYFLIILLLQAINSRRDQPLSFWQYQIVALATAGAWIVHPLNLTSVLYVVQRMTSLSTTFTIWGLIAFTLGRLRLVREQNGYGWILASLLLFLPLATLCKEIGLLLPAYMLAIELTIFQFNATQKGRRFLIALFSATILLPAIGALMFLVLNPSWLPNSYIGRAFTLDERLMTQARVLWFYLREIVAPNPVQMGLFHDDIVTSHSLFAPITTLPAIIGLALLLLVAWLSRKRAPLVSFAIVFFFAGHILESSAWPLEMVHEHRNYLPMAGILLVFFYALLYPLKYADTLRIRQFATLLLIALFTYDTWSRSIHWGDTFDLAEYEVQNHPDSARDNGEMGNYYLRLTSDDAATNDAYFLKAEEYYEKSTAVDPDYTNGLIALIMANARPGREIDPKWVSDLKHRLEFSPAEPNTGNKLTRMVQCKIEKKCNLSNQTLVDFINAALRNPTNTGSRRALVLYSLTFYLVDLTNDYPQALDVMRQMVRASPQQMEYRMMLIQYLVAMQKPEEAKKELLEAKQMDSLKAYTLQIAELEQKLGQK